MKVNSDRLTDLMAEKAIFVDDLCKRTGLVKRKVAPLMAGDPDTDQETVKQIAAVFGVQVHEIVLDGGKAVENDEVQ